jgi:hypothetical protein
MRNFTNNFQNLATRRGLRCVWVPAQEGKSMPLVASWVETREEAGDRQKNEALCGGVEPRERWPGMRLRAA